MKTKSFLNKFSSKGFTLIELLIVIAILGILAATLMVAINPTNRIASARNSRVRSDIAEMGNLANLFSNDTGSGACTNGSYPNAFNVVGNGCAGIVYMATGAPAAPTGNYVIAATPNGCTTATPCTNVAISGPSYADGTAVAGFWCWRSASGTITATTQAAAIGNTCAP
jgi:prepilin-type N-terminal cleavage/methylation domain-containing protein